jgi:hypothetical protein
MTSTITRRKPTVRRSLPARELALVGRARRPPRARPRPGTRVAAQRRARILLAVTGAAVFVLVLGAVSLQVMLIGGQRQLDHVNGDIANALVRQDGLRREESQLRSPSDVRDLATERLGMVPADLPALVQPAPRVVGYPTGDPRGAGTPTTTLVPAAGR